MTYKIEWDKELDRRARLGITNLPDPLPHPDHVIMDMRQGTARVVGPSTKEEKAEWEMWIARMADFEAEVEELREMLEAEADPKMCRILENDIAQSKKIVDMIDRALSGKPSKR